MEDGGASGEPGGGPEEAEPWIPVESDMPDDWYYRVYQGPWWWSGTPKLWVITNAEPGCLWIKHLLLLSDLTTDGKSHDFEIHGDTTFKGNVCQCCSVIFCFQEKTWRPELCDNVKKLIQYYGMKNVLLVFGGDGAADIFCDVKTKTQTWRGDLKCQMETMHFTDGEIENGECLVHKIKQLLRGLTGHTVGIFSRSSEQEYEWLKQLLESDILQSRVFAVRPSSISNRGFQQFREHVANCTFGILYHTKNRGRVNLTDVTDSLYNQELTYMSENRGKTNVIVAVDDLEDSSDENRRRILKGQPSIEERANHLFLFTAQDKRDLGKLITCTKLIKEGLTMKAAESGDPPPSPEAK